MAQGHTWRGLRKPADSPIASSMYFLSSGVMVGWAAGLSYDTRIQNRYQNIPKLPKSGARHRTYCKYPRGADAASDEWHSCGFYGWISASAAGWHEHMNPIMNGIGLLKTQLEVFLWVCLNLTLFCLFIAAHLC